MNFDHPEFREFREFVAELAKDFRLVQAKGGNGSIKLGNTVWIKSSGTRLSAAESRESWVECRREDDGGYSPIDPQSRVSIEAPLHSWLDDKYVLHLHPIGCIAWSLMHDSGIHQNSREFAVISYTRPGQDLVDALRSRCPQGILPHPLVLQNHGILLAGKTLRALRDQVAWLIDEFEKNSGEPKADLKLTRTEFSAFSDHLGSWEGSSTIWRITPDHCVFLGPNPPWEERGAWLFDDGAKSLQGLDDDSLAMLEAWLRTVKSLPNEGDTHRLIDPNEAYALRHWEAEVARLYLKS